MDHLRRCIFIFPLLMLSLSSEASAAARLEPLTVGYSNITATYAPLWLAVEEHVGAKHGLDLKAILRRPRSCLQGDQC